eukprot:g24874.t1
MRGMDKDWAKVEYPFAKPKPRPKKDMPKLPGKAPATPGQKKRLLSFIRLMPFLSTQSGFSHDWHIVTPQIASMGSALATDTIPVLVTMVDVHNAKAQETKWICQQGAATKVIGRSQTLSVEVGITTVLTLIVYECPEPVFTPETARCLGVLRIPMERLAERYSSGIFQQWFNLDTKSCSKTLEAAHSNIWKAECCILRMDPRMPAGDLQSLVTKFEQAYADSVNDIYQPKVCLSVIGSSFEVQRGSRSTFGIFVGEDVKTQAGPDLKALIASHKQQAAYVDALHEELRRLNTPSYRPLAAGMGQSQPLATFDSRADSHSLFVRSIGPGAERNSARKAQIHYIQSSKA